MSAFAGGLKRSTQHIMSDARDGVDGRWVEDMFEGSTRWPRRSCGAAGGAHSQFNRVARQLNERLRETLGFETRAERDLMLVLHRPVEPTAKSGREPLFDHVIGALQNCFREGDAERLSGLEIDDQIDFH
jgi:hypothetical protein